MSEDYIKKNKAFKQELKVITKKLYSLMSDIRTFGMTKKFTKETKHELYKILEEHSVYKVIVSYNSTNPEHEAILFTGFKSGGYWELHCNGYENKVDFGKVYTIEVLEYLCKMK